MSLHVSFTRTDDVCLRVLWCWTCQGRRTCMTRFQEWYGWRGTCLACGERWEDGQQLERPFMPRWRQKSIAEARTAGVRLGLIESRWVRE